MIVSMDKGYTLDGDQFTVLTATKPGRLPVLGYTPDGTAYHFQDDGTSVYGGEKLVEVSPYADFVIDEKVMVRDRHTEQWWKRYFAGVNPMGNPLTFDFGNTKWSNEGDGKVDWQQCCRPTAEELAA